MTYYAYTSISCHTVPTMPTIPYYAYAMPTMPLFHTMPILYAYYTILCLFSTTRCRSPRAPPSFTIYHIKCQHL